MAVKMIRYSIMYYNGEGHAPLHQILSFGCTFDGGRFAKDGCYLGYIEHEDEDVIDECINSLGAYNVTAIEDATMAKRLILDALGSESYVNEFGETRYYGVPTWDSETNRFIVPDYDTPQELPTMTDAEKKRRKVIQKVKNGIYKELTTKFLEQLNAATDFDDFVSRMNTYFDLS